MESEESRERERAVGVGLGAVLLVEDEPGMRLALRRLLEPRSERVEEATSVVEAIEALETGAFDLVVLDVRLGDQSGVRVAEAIVGLPRAPAVVAVSGDASPEEAFSLARCGVRAYVPKGELPDRLDELVAMAREAPPVEGIAKAQVGARSVRDVQEVVREMMLDQALAESGGNQSEAARRLGVTRQAVQQMLARRRKH
ncbi:MAG TPA: response regulator [Sandaracinaceae bacterium LLY-WYZ-13_1]|nr:response regulator [Sandaracinaceae bacterium LLY-WYZ-13_1]